MCTVSYYKDTKRIIITSNRDENINRPLALAPEKYYNGLDVIIYPLDPVARGTWFCAKDDGSILVLLNGAEVKHKPAPPYRKSRGLILLDLIQSSDFIKSWNEINLKDIEPFTIVASIHERLYQCRWNTINKSIQILDSTIANIWSSTTLYSPEVIYKRKEWFEEFLKSKKEFIEPDDFIEFHSNTQKNDTQNGLIINRNQIMLTKNITQCILEKNKIFFKHYDLITKESTEITISLR